MGEGAVRRMMVLDSFPSYETGRADDAPRESRERSFLVVDESPTNRVLATEILSKLGHGASPVAAVATPREALARFDAERPTVVLMELDYEDADGLPALLAILARDPRVRIVVLTAAGLGDERVRRAVRAGAFAVVEKPLRHDKIRAVLADLDMEEGGLSRMR